MTMVRNAFGLACSCALVGTLYGFPVIVMVASQLLGLGELETVADTKHYETRVIHTPMFAPEGVGGEDAIADDEPEQKTLEQKQPVAEKAPPPATKAMVDAAEPIETALVETAVVGADDETAAAKRGKKCLADDEGIVQVDDTTWRIDGGIVDYYVKHINQAQKLASVGWNRNVEGKVDGFKVKRMRCGNVLRQAGLENGDVIQSINGKTVHSIPTAIAAYTKLRTKNVLRLTVSRGGEIVHIKYKLS